MRGEFTTYEEAFAAAMRLKYPPTSGLLKRLPMTCEIRLTARWTYQLIEVA